MTDVNLAQLLINFVTLSSFYSCFAVGLALVFGIMRVINFAHGEFYMLGGYAVWVVMTVASGLPLPVVFIMALIVGPLAVGLIGLLLERFIFRRIEENPFAGFMASLGLAYALQVLAATGFGVVSKSLPVMFPGSFSFLGGVITSQRLVVVLFSIVMMLWLWGFLTRTRTGRAMRATAQNKESALLQGISLGRMSGLAMAIGAALAAVSGALMGSVINIGPFMGLEAIWKAFIVVIVGGMGSIPGAIAAALLFGLLDSTMSTFGAGQFIIMIDTLIMLLVLAFFPNGLLGRDSAVMESRTAGLGAVDIEWRPLARRVGLPMLLVFALVLPYLLPAYLQDSLVLFTISCIIVMSYRLVTTMGGWSFAHIATMALGAYTMAMLTTEYASLPFWLTIPLGGLVAGLFALAISYPVLRTRQFYFFLSTFAAGEALRQCFIQFKSVFGGIEGIPFINRPGDILGINFFDTVNYYFLVLFFALLCGGIMYAFDKSTAGRTVKAVAANEHLSESLGINTWRYKALAFVLGSFFVGIAGVFFSNYNGFVAPTDYTTAFMFKIIAAAIIGGTRSFAGPLLGLIVLTVIQELLRDFYQIVPLIWGAIIILIMLFMPNGLESLLARAKPQGAGQRGREPAAARGGSS
ncbi:MAG: ABC transporter permease [Kiloniellales bacterium]